MSNKNVDDGGVASVSSNASFTKNPEAIELPGKPEFLGTAAKVVRDREGNTRITLTSFATYEDRTVSVGEEIDLDTTQIDELLTALVEQHQVRLGRRVLRAAMQSWEIAVRKGEMEE